MHYVTFYTALVSQGWMMNVFCRQCVIDSHNEKILEIILRQIDKGADMNCECQTDDGAM